MSFNYGMNNMANPMMGMGMMGMGSMNTSGNVWQAYTAKYGCEDCFCHEPNFFELHSKVQEREHRSVKPNFWQRFLTRLGC